MESVLDDELANCGRDDYGCRRCGACSARSQQPKAPLQLVCSVTTTVFDNLAGRAVLSSGLPHEGEFMPILVRRPTFLIILLSLSLSTPLASRDLVAPAPLDEDVVYTGWLGSRLARAVVVSEQGHELGQVRRITMGSDGRIAEFVAEQAGIGLTPEFVFRLPWKYVARLLRPAVIVASFDKPKNRHIPDASHRGRTEHQAQHHFRLTDVVDDNARLKTGRLYGTVTDAVFSTDGKLIAVLVTRDAVDGGGTLAFPFPSQLRGWSPFASYYGLPFVTRDQADAAGVRIDWNKFKGRER